MPLLTSAPALATLEIMNMNYSIAAGAPKTILGSPVTVAKIGSDIYIEAFLLNYTGARFTGVNAVTATSTAVTITDPFGRIGTTGSNYYVSDGRRTWHTQAVGPNTIVLNDSGLNGTGFYPPTTSLALQGTTIMACPVLPVTAIDLGGSDYTNIDVSSLVVVDGSAAAPVTGSTAVFADLGTLLSGVNLKDDGTLTGAGDCAPDGIYHGRITVQRSDKWFAINASVVGHASPSTIGTALNDPYYSPRAINVDGIAPSLTLLNSIPSIFYIVPNPVSMGTSNSNPANGRSDLHFTLLDKSASVTVTVLNSAGTVVYNFPVQKFGVGDHYVSWDGRDNSNVFVSDGVYTFRVEAQDDLGNSAIVKLGEVQVTGISLEVTNLSMSPNPAPSDNGTGQDGTITNITFRTKIHGATQAALAYFGLDKGAGAAADSRPYALLTINLYNSAGVLVHSFGPDLNDLVDYDEVLQRQPAVGGYKGPAPCQPTVWYDYQFNPTGIVSASTPYDQGDGDKGNDWDTLQDDIFDKNNDGEFGDPGDLSTLPWDGAYAVSWVGNNFPAGTYIVEVQAKLAAKVVYDLPLVTVNDPCAPPTVTSQVSVVPHHAAPALAGISSPAVQGFLFLEDNTLPTGDTQPPQIVAVSPGNNSTVPSGQITDSNPVWALLQDNNSGVSGTKTSIQLIGPDLVKVPGTVANDGGTGAQMKFYFLPASPLKVGGQYTLNIIPVDRSNNTGAVQSFTFTVTDQSVPFVSSVQVTSLGVKQYIYPSSPGTLGNASQVDVVLVAPLGGATVDFAKSNVYVSDSAGTTQYPGVLTSNPSTSTLTFVLDNLLLNSAVYRVTVDAWSSNGARAVYAYNFSISSGTMVFVNYNGGVTYQSDETVLYFQATGMTVQNGAVTVAFGGISASAAGPLPLITGGVCNQTSQDLSAGSTMVGRSIAFTPGQLTFVSSVGQRPVVRIHFYDTEVYSGALDAYIYDGSVWKKVKNIPGMVQSGITKTLVNSDNYVEITGSSQAYPYYALFVPPPAQIPGALNRVVLLESTRSFKPGNGALARFMYLNTPAILPLPTDVTARIYNLRGDLVRILTAGKEIVPANNFDSSLFPNGPVQHYFDWDGLNGSGAMLKNGVYIVDVEWSLNGAKDKKTLPVALLR